MSALQLELFMYAWRTAFLSDDVGRRPWLPRKETGFKTSLKNVSGMSKYKQLYLGFHIMSLNLFSVSSTK